MDLKSELQKLVPPAARSLFGLDHEDGRFGAVEAVDLTILFTDIANYTSMTDSMGDDAAHMLVRLHNSIVREALAAHGGVEVKHTGDGIMAYFFSAARGLECAVAIQSEIRRSNSSPAAPRLEVAIGLNTGAPVVEDGDLFGTAVITAARITDHAHGAQILVADVVRLLAAGKGFTFRYQGEEILEGLRQPVGLYEVDWRESLPSKPAEDSEAGEPR